MKTMQMTILTAGAVLLAVRPALAASTTPLTPYLDKGYAIAPNKLTRSLVCFDASKAYSSSSKSPTVWSFAATDAGAAFKLAMSDSDGPMSNPDEAKLRDGGRTLLLTGSWISGWAEIDVATKQPRRYMRDTTTYNTHSIEKLPDGTLVTANSTGNGTYNNALVLITTDANGNHTYKKAFSLYGAHGVEWDEKRNCLWACGNSASDNKGRATLYKLTYDPSAKTLTQVDSIQYKSDNDTVAHGLRLSADGSVYCTAYRIYRVDPDTKTVTEVLNPSNQAKGVHYDSTYGMVYQISGYISGASDVFLNDHVTVVPPGGSAYDVYPTDATRMYKVGWVSALPAMYVPYISNGESFWCGGDGALSDANCANDSRTASKAAFKSGNRLVFGGYESPDITVGAATSAAGITAAHGTTTLAGEGVLTLSDAVVTEDADAAVVVRTPVAGPVTKVGKGKLVLDGSLAGVTALSVTEGTVVISNALPKGVTAQVSPGATFIDDSPTPEPPVPPEPGVLTVRYVSPTGSGTKDGSSPENASADLAAAYAEAANGARSDNPSEVRLAAGLYTLTAPIAMKPYVKVIGATDGETILSGDQGKADYWRNYLSGNLGNVIQDGAVYLPDYPDDPYSAIAAYDADQALDIDHAFTCETADAPTNVFQNLTFVLFRKAAIFSEGASTEGLLIDSCRFYANNIMAVTSSTANGGAVDLRKGCATVKDSVFRYNGFGVRFADASAEASSQRNRVINCRFLNNYCKQQYSINVCGTGGVVARDKSLVDIVGCTFFRCVYKEGNLNDGDNSGGAVAVSSTGPDGSASVISNCQFVANANDNNYGNSACVVASQKNLLEIVGCSFVSNLYYSTVAGYLKSSCVTVRESCKRLIVRDTYFADNVMTNSASGSGDVFFGSVVAVEKQTPITFLNCTVERNLTVVPGYTGTCGPATLCVPRASKFALVNCLLQNNDAFASGGRRLAEIARDTIYNSSDLNIVNTIMTHDAADYLPFVENFTSQRGIILGTSVIKNFTWGEDFSQYSTGCTDYGCLLTPVKPTTEVDLRLAPRLKRQDNAVARGLSGAATKWIRKGGTPVYRGTDNRFYIWNPTSPASTGKPWWCLDQHQGKFTDAQMAAVGIVKDATPVVADAFGAPRPFGKIALGPMNTLPAGTTVLLH